MHVLRTRIRMDVPELPPGISLSGYQGNTVHAHRKMARNPSTNVVHFNTRHSLTLLSSVYR